MWIVVAEYFDQMICDVIQLIKSISVNGCLNHKDTIGRHG